MFENFPNDPLSIVVIAIVLVVGWVLLRLGLKLTAALFRVGCFIIFLIIAGIALLSLLN